MSSGKIINISTSDENSPVLSNDNDPSYVLSYYKKTIKTEKELKNIVKGVEKLVRSSSEYKQYIAYLRKEIKLTSCSVFSNIDTSDDNGIEGVSLEMHHFPFTLYDICETIVINNIIMGLEFSTFTLSSEVVGLHFNNLIGVVPLSKTVHELVHSGTVVLSLDMVYGDYPTFIELYTGSFSKNVIKKINKIIENNKDLDATILQQTSI